MPSSMTGFARKEIQHPWGTLTCEIRSVNHRYLETNFRLSDSLREFEPAIRDALKNQVSRGKIEVSLQLKTDSSTHIDLELNNTLAEKIETITHHVRTQIAQTAPINPLELLKWPGMLRSAEIDPKSLEAGIKSVLQDTLVQFKEMRSREGEALKTFILQRIEDIDEKTRFLRGKVPEILKGHQDKLRAKLESLAVELDEDRFAQEAVYLAQKADVGEELDRLEAHCKEAKLALNQTTPVGRRLDFLMQEFNREANTLSSKSSASDTTQIAVDMKVLIEQMREQVQNIE